MSTSCPTDVEIIHVSQTNFGLKPYLWQIEAIRSQLACAEVLGVKMKTGIYLCQVLYYIS